MGLYIQKNSSQIFSCEWLKKERESERKNFWYYLISCETSNQSEWKSPERNHLKTHQLLSYWCSGSPWRENSRNTKKLHTHLNQFQEFNIKERERLWLAWIGVEFVYSFLFFGLFSPHLQEGRRKMLGVGAIITIAGPFSFFDGSDLAFWWKFLG